MIIIPGEPEPKPLLSSLAGHLYATQLKRVLTSGNVLRDRIKIMELRKSCGVESTERFSWNIEGVS